MTAARISMGSLASDAWNAAAEPWNVACMLAGSPTSCRAWFTALIASPSDVRGARLNEMVTAGNCPRWFTLIGPVVSSMWANALSGTCDPDENAIEDGIVPLDATPVALVLEACGVVAVDDAGDDVSP